MVLFRRCQLPRFSLLPLLFSLFPGPPAVVLSAIPSHSPFGPQLDNLFSWDSPSATFPSPSERSLLPGIQVFPSAGAQSFQTLSGLQTGAMDVESWSKGQAVRTNQENAVVAQLAQMASQHRNKLARDMANGNASAANELVARVMRELATSQTGRMTFPQLSPMTAADQQRALLAADPNAGGAMPFSSRGGPNAGASNLLGPSQSVMAQMWPQQLLQQQQMLAQQQLAGGRQPPGSSSFPWALQPNFGFLPQLGTNFPLPVLSPENERLLLRQQQQQHLLQLQSRPQSFAASATGAQQLTPGDFSDLSRPPVSPFLPVSSSSPVGSGSSFFLSQPQQQRESAGKTPLSGAGLLSQQLGSRATDDPKGAFSPSVSSPSNRGFVDDLDMEEVLSRALGQPSGTVKQRRREEGSWRREGAKGHSMDYD